MGVFEAIVVFVISWWLVLLPTLSMGSRSQHESGEVIRGTEPAAPVTFPFARKALISTVGAAIITGLIWLALQMGWLAAFVPV